MSMSLFVHWHHSEARCLTLGKHPRFFPAADSVMKIIKVPGSPIDPDGGGVPGPTLDKEKCK
jgi:hypothetical protein